MAGRMQTLNMPRIVPTRLRKARTRASLTQTALAKRVGTASTQISMLESGNSTASLRNAARIAEALNVSTDYLVGRADDPRRTADLIHELQLAEQRNGRHTTATAPDEEQVKDDIAILEVDTAAGAGALVGCEHVVGYRKFPRAWLQEQNLSADRCRLIRVAGNSMEPTLADKASILVDLARSERRDGKVVVIRIGEELVVKRTINAGEAGWILVSDNADKTTWPNRPWPDNGAVVGEVRWTERTLT